MSDYDFKSIKHAVRVWFDKISINDNNYRIAKDNDKVLLIDFVFANCLAQLSVTDSPYQPFQYVLFEAGDSEMETGSRIYFYWDTEDTLRDEVITSLDKAYEFCVNYQGQKTVPDL